MDLHPSPGCTTPGSGCSDGDEVYGQRSGPNKRVTKTGLLVFNPKDTGVGTQSN